MGLGGVWSELRTLWAMELAPERPYRRCSCPQGRSCAAQEDGGFAIEGDAEVNPSVGFSFASVGANAKITGKLGLVNQGGTLDGDLTITAEAGFELPWPCGPHQVTSTLLSGYQVFSTTAPSWWP